MKPEIPFLVRRGDAVPSCRTAQVVVGRVARLTSRSCRPTTTMHSTRDAGIAGFLLLSTALLCGAIGLGIGALVGAAMPLAVVGVFIGFGLGFRLVYARYRDL
jgi:hypothetical protein